MPKTITANSILERAKKGYKSDAYRIQREEYPYLSDRQLERRADREIVIANPHELSPCKNTIPSQNNYHPSKLTAHYVGNICNASALVTAPVSVSVSAFLWSLLTGDDYFWIFARVPKNYDINSHSLQDVA